MGTWHLLRKTHSSENPPLPVFRNDQREIAIACLIKQRTAPLMNSDTWVTTWNICVKLNHKIPRFCWMLKTLFAAKNCKAPVLHDFPCDHGRHTCCHSGVLFRDKSILTYNWQQLARARRLNTGAVNCKREQNKNIFLELWKMWEVKPKKPHLCILHTKVSL